MKNRRKRNSWVFLLVILLAVTIGYALLSTTLKINGSASITKNNWSVYWDNVGNVEKTDTVTVTTAAVVDSTDNTQVNFGVTLNYPGDYYEFQVDAVNAGTIDAMINIFTSSINGNPVSSLPNYVSYVVSYADGGDIETNHLLAKKDGNTLTRERYKVRIEWLKTITNEQLAAMPSGGEPLVVDIDLDYKQADSNAKRRVVQCPGCTYKLYTDWESRYYSANNTFNEDQTRPVAGYTNYRIIQNYYGSNATVFVGEVINNGLLDRAFTCMVYNNKLLCTEGKMDNSAYDTNKEKLYAAFGEYDSTTGIGCSESSAETTCNGGGSIVATAYKAGGTMMNNGNYQCNTREYGDVQCTYWSYAGNH